MEKKKLKVGSVGEWKSFGESGGKVKTFQAVVSDGKTVSKPMEFKIFEETFDPYLVKDKIFEADVDTTQKGEYTNRRILQIYIDGKPVKEAKKGYPPRGKSLEERKSIEAQVAIKKASDLACYSMIAPHEILSYAEAFREFMNGNLVVQKDDAFKVATQHCKQK